MSDLTAVRPAEPLADLKARVAAAVEAARSEIIDLSHRIHANPEPAFEEHQAATWIAEVLRGHGFEVEHPAGSLATAIRAVVPGRPGRRRPAHRDPRRVRRPARVSATAAATTRWPRPGSVPRSRWRRVADEPPGRDRLPRHAGRGTGQRQADHDRRRAVRGHRRRPALPPVRPEPRREPPARVRGLRGRVHGPAGARVLRSVAGPERARRDDHAVQQRRPVAAAAPPDGSDPRDHHAKAARPRTSSRTEPRPGSCCAATTRPTTRR